MSVLTQGSVESHRSVAQLGVWAFHWGVISRGCAKLLRKAPTIGLSCIWLTSHPRAQRLCQTCPCAKQTHLPPTEPTKRGLVPGVFLNEIEACAGRGLTKRIRWQMLSQTCPCAKQIHPSPTQPTKGYCLQVPFWVNRSTCVKRIYFRPTGDWAALAETWVRNGGIAYISIYIYMNTIEYFQTPTFYHLCLTYVLQRLGLWPGFSNSILNILSFSGDLS